MPATLVLLLVVALPATASAATRGRDAYVADSGDDAVSVIDTATNAVVGPPIAVGSDPTAVAISPDGSRAYVTDSGAAAVSAIDTKTDSVVATIAVGSQPSGIAVSPAGSRAYVANSASNTVSVIDTATNIVAGPPIAVGAHPQGVAISPDGARTYIAQQGGVAVIDTRTSAVLGVLKDELGPSQVAISADGAYAYVTNNSSSSVSLFNLSYGLQVGVPILAGANPAGIAIAAQGAAYVANSSDATVTAIDTERHTVIGPPIPGFNLPTGVAISTDGSRAYVTNRGEASVSILDSSLDQVIGSIPAGSEPMGIAIVPDQPPHAHFAFFPVRVSAGKPVSFDASGSADPDGQIASYAWSFGDGQDEERASPTAQHTYAAPGTYQVKLTLTDGEGCSTSLVISGATAICNGSPLATTVQSLDVIDVKPPLFHLRGARRRRLARIVAVTARCPRERCRVRVRGALIAVGGRASARHASPKRPRLSFKTSVARAALAPGRRAKLRLRLPARATAVARRSLAAGGRAFLRVAGTAVDPAGKRAKRRVRIRFAVARKRARGAKR